MYLRLALDERDGVSQQGGGVFSIAYELLRGGELAREDSARLKELLVWFEKSLPLPDRARLGPRAIFWFKAGAGEAARRVWQLAELVGRHGAAVEVHKTKRPGRLVYEDDLQVGAIPFRDTFQARLKRQL